MKRLLLITPFFRPNIGGVETSLDRICNALDEKGHRVDVLTYQPIVNKRRGQKREQTGGVVIRRYGWLGGDLFHRLESHPVLQVLYLCPYLFFITLCYVWNHRKQIHMIHAPGFAAALVARIVQLITGISYVVSTHAIYDGIYHLPKDSFPARIIRWVLGGATSILALSADSKKELLDLGIPENRIDVYTTLVDPKTFRPLDRQACRRQLGLDNGKPNILFVSRLLPKKGADIVIKAAKRMPGVRFLFVGSGPMESEVRTAAKQLENVVYFGRIDNPELPTFYNAADLFVTIPRYRECFNRTIIEALLCGTPVIFSDMDVAKDVVDPSAALAIPPSVSSLCHTLDRLISHPDRITRMAQRSRGYAVRQFGEKNIAVFLKAYGWSSDSAGSIHGVLHDIQD